MSNPSKALFKSLLIKVVVGALPWVFCFLYLKHFTFASEQSLKMIFMSGLAYSVGNLFGFLSGSAAVLKLSLKELQ